MVTLDTSRLPSLESAHGLTEAELSSSADEISSLLEKIDARGQGGLLR